MARPRGGVRARAHRVADVRGEIALDDLDAFRAPRRRLASDADALLPRPPASSLGSRDAASALSAGPETRCALTACRSSLASASISLFFFAAALSSRRSRSLHFATASLMLSTVTESSPFAMRRIMLRPSFMCRFTTQDSVGGRAGCHDGVRPE